MSSRQNIMTLKLVFFVFLFLSSHSPAEEITDQWRWSTETQEGDRKLSHSFTLYRKGETFEGHAGKACSISGGREKEIPLEKVEFDKITRKVSFMMFFDDPDNEDGSRRTFDAKFEGSLGDRHIVGNITYINSDEKCLRPVEGSVTMNYMDTGAKSDLVKAIIPPTANVKGRYDIRIIGRPQMGDLNNKKAWMGGRGHAFVGGGKVHFKDFKSPSQIEIDFIGKAFETYKACAPIAREGASDTKKVIQIIGDGKLDQKATKNPKNPIGMFTLKTLTRCREIDADRKPFN